MSRTFERFAGACAMVAGVGGLAYSLAFILVVENKSRAAAYATGIFLLAGGLLASAVLVALYGRLREIDPGFALWATILGAAGGLGSAIHGAYTLGSLFHQIRGADFGNLPNSTDPRGFLTFGVTGIAIAIVSWLLLRQATWPKNLAYLGMVSAVLLVLIYLGRLIILNPKNPGLLGAAALEGFVVNPIWFIWVGSLLRRDAAAEARPA